MTLTFKGDDADHITPRYAAMALEAARKILEKDPDNMAEAERVAIRIALSDWRRKEADIYLAIG